MPPLLTSPWRSLRAQTPAADAFIHLNHASTSLPDQAVFDAQRNFLELEASLGTHRAVDRMGDALAEVPAWVARLIGAQPEHIAFVDSAARGWAQALSAVAPGQLLEVFVSRQEWAANVMMVANLARASMTIVPHPVDGNWTRVVATALDQRDRSRTPVVSLPLQSSFCGEPNRLDGVASLVRHAAGWLFVDASQAVGQSVVDMQTLGADVLVFPARKWLRGPRGISVLALSARALSLSSQAATSTASESGTPHVGLPAMLDVHGTRIDMLDGTAVTLSAKPGASRFQTYDYSPVLRLGLRAAVATLLASDVDKVNTQILAMAAEVRKRMAQINGIDLADAGGSGLVCLRVIGGDHQALVRRLWQRNINIATVGAVYAPLAFVADDSVLRLSPHVLNQEWELDRVQEDLAQEVDDARNKHV
jgi:cysteine desulfurase/selenocysteine lyase